MAGEKKGGRYDDIVDTAYPFPLKRPRMSQGNRAAQFSAFAALSGYEEAICEAARTTDKRIDLDEGATEILNAKLRLLDAAMEESPSIAITYFSQDEKKDGGAYHTVSENVQKIDAGKRCIVAESGRIIPFDDIYDLQADLFRCLEDGDD